MKLLITKITQIREGLYQVEVNNKYGFVYPAKDEKEAIEESLSYFKAKSKGILEYIVKD